MAATNVDKIKDAALRETMATAHKALKDGDFQGVVQRSADVYLELLKRKPELLAEGGIPARMRIMMFPRLGAHLKREGEEPPELVWDRQNFGFSEAVTYFEFAVDQLVGEGL